MIICSCNGISSSSVGSIDPEAIIAYMKENDIKPRCRRCISEGETEKGDCVEDSIVLFGDDSDIPVSR